MSHLITHSRLACWRRCQREHHYRYVLGRVAKASQALRFGALVHAGLEAWWLTFTEAWDHLGGELRLGWALAAMAEGNPDPFDLARAEAMLIGYDARWADAAAQYKVLAVEHEFRAPLPGSGQAVQGSLPLYLEHHVACFARNGRWGTCADCPRDAAGVYPERCQFADNYDHALTARALDEVLGQQLRTRLLGVDLRNWEIAGKLDVLVRERATGRVLVIEHKTSSEDVSPGSAYWQRLRLDGQVSLYHLADERIEGVIYDVLAKPGEKPLKATPEASRKWVKEKWTQCPRCAGVGYLGMTVDDDDSKVIFGGQRGDYMACPACRTDQANVAPGQPKQRPGYIVTEPTRLHAHQRLHDESPEQYRARLVAEIAADPARYYARAEIVRLERERTEHLVQLRTQARAVAQGGTVQTPEACTRFGAVCAYLGACTGERSIEDYESLGWVHPELTAPREAAEE